MTRTLVTGGTGTLGRRVSALLLGAGGDVRVMSRRAPRAGEDVGREWAVADLASGAGLAEAVSGADVVVHAASDPAGSTEATDVDGTVRLLGAARGAGCRHFVYVSIVGVDRIPFPYYRAKLAAEERVAEAGIGHTIVRITQFHDFLDWQLSRMVRIPLLAPLPTRVRFQPIDVGDAAAALLRCTEEGPAGRVPDVGGPEVLELGALARSWLAARGVPRRVVHVPVPTAFVRALRDGHACAPEGRVGRVTWTEWLEERYGPTG